MRDERIFRFDYGCLVPWVTRMKDGSLLAMPGPDMVFFQTSVRLREKSHNNHCAFEFGGSRHVT